MRTMRGLAVYLTVISIANYLAGSTTDYRGSKIYECSLNTSNAQVIIEKLEATAEATFFDILKYPRQTDGRMNVLVRPEGMKYFAELLKAYSLEANVLDEDVERSVLKEKIANANIARSERRRRFTGRLSHRTYLPFHQIDGYLQSYASISPYADYEDIGRTSENRSIPLLKIRQNQSLPIIWIDAGIHAREWIAPATALFIIDKLLSADGEDLLKSHQFYIAPNINPDGYEFSFRSSRYWRKNRNRSSTIDCVGVDLNRNYPYKWGERGSSSWPCSETYRGTQAGDQPETQAVIKKLRALKNKVKLYITLHSYGQFLLTPYGFEQGQYPPKYDKLLRMASKVISRIMMKHGTIYQTGSAADLLYAAAGGSDDYACGTLKIPYSYTIELPDNGSYNFLLPPAYIPAVGEQIWLALETLVAEMNAEVNEQ